MELQHIQVFVPKLNNVFSSMNVIFDEIEDVSRNHENDGIILDDFTYLVNMIYRDTDNGLLMESFIYRCLCSKNTI